MDRLGAIAGWLHIVLDIIKQLTYDMTVKAIGYARRSKESGDRTISLEDQRERIEAYCRESGFRLVEVLTDDGISGGKRERFERIRDALRPHRARAVVVYHLDRFARDLAGGLDTLDGFAKRGVELHVVGRGKVDADTASGFLTTSVELLLADHYRRLVGEKTRDALARLRAQGRRYSNIVPYGYDATPEGLLVENEGEQRVVSRMIELRNGGLTYRAVAHALAREGILARGERPFATSSVHKILTAVHDRTIVDSRANRDASQRPQFAPSATGPLPHTTCPSRMR